MDSDLMKLLEQDEDETMHSSADVEAFQAALNRDIKGGSDASTSQPSNQGLAQDGNHTFTQSFPPWQTSGQVDANDSQSQQSINSMMDQETQSSLLEQEKHVSPSISHQENSNVPQDVGSLLKKEPHDDIHEVKEENIPLHTSQPTRMQIFEKPSKSVLEPDKIPNSEAELQYTKLQKMSDQQMESVRQESRALKLPFGELLPRLQTLVDKEKSMRLQALFDSLRRNEIPKDHFVRHIKGIVGDQILRAVAVKCSKGPVRAMQQQPHVRMPSVNASPVQYPSNHPLTHHQKGPSFHADSSQIRPMGQLQTGSSLLTTGSNGLTSHEPDSRERERSSIPVQGHIKQQHMHFPQPSHHMHGSGGSNHPYRGPDVTTSVSSLKPQVHGVHMTQSMNTSQIVAGQLENVMNVPKLERQNSFSDPKRMQGTSKDESLERQSSRVGLPPSTGMTPSNFIDLSSSSQAELSKPFGSRMPAVASPAGFERMPAKRSSIGQKKPFETVGSSPSSASKKQKVSGNFADESIDSLNDVTVVSGVNLREEEEQLFSGPKEDSRVSEISRRVMQEEEEKLILQKNPLQKKLAEIMAKCGLKSINNDVERCLSLCVEERLRGLISNLIRISKQRMDTEKPRHRTLITSDIRQQIMAINQKAREEWEIKHSEAEKPDNDPDNDSAADGDKEKDKLSKVNKEEDDKMRTTAANVAARAAVGGDDMLSKWQLMAEQNKKKLGGGTDLPSGSQTGKDASRKPFSAFGRNSKDNQEAERRGQPAFGAGRRMGRNQGGGGAENKVARSISVKDVISVLEREPQMSKSALMYCLYEKKTAA